MQNPIEELKHKIQTLTTSKNKYKKELKYHYEVFASYGMESLSDVIDFIDEKKQEKEKDEEIMGSWGFNSLDEITKFINKYRNHKCDYKSIKYLSHKELIENNYYSQMINSNYILKEQLEHKSKELDYFRKLYLKDEEKRKENILLDSGVNENNLYIKSYISDMINNHMDDDILYKIIENKKKTKKCDDNLCIEFIPNKFRYCYHHYDLKMKNLNTPKINIKYDNIKKNTKIYNIKININEIPIIIEHHKYEQSNLKNCQLVPYFDINKYFINLKVLFDKYNLSFKNPNTPKINIKKVNNIKLDQKKEADLVLGRIKKSLELLNKKKINKENIYNVNRRIIDTYSYLHNNMHEYDSYIDINVEGLKIDKNKSRFITISKLFNIIKNTPELYNSEYIFNYYTFKKINNEGLDFMIKNLNEICYNEKNKYWSIYKNHIEYDDYYDKIIENEINKEQEEDYEDSDYDGFVNSCVFCENTEDLDPSTGICNECNSKMSKYNK